MHWGSAMTDKNQINDAELETFFEAARAAPPAVPDALMAAVLADAGAVQAAPKNSGWGAWLANLGGLPGLGGLVTATCVGFWLGVAPPEVMPDLAGFVLGTEAVLEDGLASEPGLDGFGWDLDEG